MRRLEVILISILMGLMVGTGLRTVLRAEEPLVEVPPGGIIMWSGPVDQVPAGWALCDGSGGTPDLRARFVVGVGLGYSVGDVGGSEAHRHEINLTQYANPGAGLTWFGTAHRSEAADSRPPYYALAFIMRVDRGNGKD